jgi:N-acetylmuramic acid 6-phosphate etherase
MGKAVRMIVASLRNGGHLFFIGAGTSGRLGVLEAAECPPTFNTPPSLIRAFMAGGKPSVFKSKEGAEDRGMDSARLIRKNVKRNDVVIGIAASGVTSFVKEGLRVAKKRGAKTILVTCNPRQTSHLADVVIAPRVGPEVIAGSTRLKAATATKLVLNSLTVTSMIQLGKVYGNRMVDLQPKSNKLKARALRLIQLLAKVSPKKAETLYIQSGKNAKTAILMGKKNLKQSDAVRLLKKTAGHLHAALTLKR